MINYEMHVRAGCVQLARPVLFLLLFSLVSNRLRTNKEGAKSVVERDAGQLGSSTMVPICRRAREGHIPALLNRRHRDQKEVFREVPKRRRPSRPIKVQLLGR